MLRAAVALCGALMVQGLASADDDLQSVPVIDLARYMGQWHEIARYPNQFQSECLRNTTAHYGLLPNGRVQVINRCERDDGSIDEAVGEARRSGVPGRLEVSFAPQWLSWLPWVWAPYWVIELAPDYRYAVVSEPGREYLWILARQASLPIDDERDIFSRLTEQGFDTAKLRRSNPTGPIPTIPSESNR